MPFDTVTHVMHYFVIFDSSLPLGFAFLFLHLNDWILMILQGHQLLIHVEDPTQPQVT